MANPTEQELDNAYGDNYSHVVYEDDNVLRTAQTKEGDLSLISHGRSTRLQLVQPQKKVSFTKKDKEDAGRPLDIRV